ncbi:hypothetical protein FB45DRAFT_1061558 [Roridomyces roridus]|uniref:F-box domain-containing protein n=1 Tax=Roridomyces roridus TaxID=1738132 RepID=A0AAD7FJK9_9AGAR|nr:hypothetical protein FB45DRAFT_1061558 [Roridomyces roridus]
MNESAAPTTLTFPPDLVPELHALILSNLPYFDLLCVKCVARKWRAIIESDPALQVQTFKKATSEYRDNGVDDKCSQKESEPVTVGFLALLLAVGASTWVFKMHPALQRVSFYFNEPIFKMILYDAPVVSAGVLDDLATIPAVHTFKICSDMDEDESWGGFSFNVKNNQGITVRNVLTQIYKAGKKYAGDLQDHDHYEGLDGLKRTGTKLVGGIVLTG